MIPAGGSSSGGPDSVVSAANSTTAALAGSATFTGPWEDITRWVALTVSIVCNEPGVAYAEFSHDGSTTHRSVQINSTDGVPSGIHGLIRVAPYFRLRIVNGSEAQSSLSVSTIYSKFPLIAVPTSRAGQAYNNYSDVVNVRSLRDPRIDEAATLNADATVYAKFGYNTDVAAGTWEDIWSVGGTYSGWLTAASAVRIKAGGHANDAAAGSGAQSIFVEGLDENWEIASEEIATNGASESTATTTTFLRVYRAYVGSVGTYTGSNAGTITVETTGGAVVSAIPMINGIGTGQSGQSMFTIPAGYTGFVRRIAVSVTSTKPADVLFQRRSNADDVTTPFTGGARTWHNFLGFEGQSSFEFGCYPSFPAKTDLWVSGYGPSGGAAMTATIDIVLIRNS